MKRWRRTVVIGLVAVAIAGAGAVVWHQMPQRRPYYTDAESIREPKATAPLRDVLWQPPTRLSEVVNTGEQDYEPRLSWDGLTLFFVRGKAGENADIYVSERTPEGWTEPQPLTDINSSYEDLGPEPAGDGESLYFYSDRPGGSGGYDIWVSHRIGERWQPPNNLGPRVNSEFNDYGPAVTADGQSLYFASNRPLPEDEKQPDPEAWPATLREDLFHRTYDLYFAPLTQAGAGRAEPVAALNTRYNEGSPCVSPVGDFLYFASDRPGGEGGFDLYRVRMVKAAGPDRYGPREDSAGTEPGRYGPSKEESGPAAAPERGRAVEYRKLTNLGPPVNSASNELDPGMAQLGYALYFSSDRERGKVGTGESEKAGTGDGGDRGSRERGEVAADYNLYYTSSREVFLDVETLRRPPIDWAALLRTILPNLLWLLLALLAVLLLLALLGDLRGRKLSLLARCLLASLLLHLLLLLLMSFWEVTAGVMEALRRRGEIQIALVNPTQGDSLAAQIRGALTEVETPEVQTVEVQRVETVMEAEARAVQASLTVARIDMPVEAQPEVTPEVRDSPQPPIEQPEFEPVARSSSQSMLEELKLPASAARVHEREQEPRFDSRSTRTTRTERPPIAVATSQPVRPPREMAVLPREGERRESVEPAHSLAEMSEGRQADRDVPLQAKAAPSAAPLDDAPALALALPSETLPAEQPVEESQPRAPPVVAASPRVEVEPRAPPEQVQEQTYKVEPTRGSIPTSDVTLAAAVDVRDASAPDLELPVNTNRARVASSSPPLADLRLPQTGQTAIKPSPEQAPAVAAREARSSRPESLPEAVTTAGRSGPIVALAPVRPGGTNGGTEGLFETPSTALAQDNPAPTPPGEPSTALAKRTSPMPLRLRVPAGSGTPMDHFSQRDREQRHSLLERLGGNEETERAVRRALQWLAKHQRSDGEWDGLTFDEGCGQCGGETEYAVDVALTGLSLLCFLGAGHTHVEAGPYQDNVRRGLAWLLNRQDADGDLRDGETMYSHGIALIALAEVYGMTRDPALGEAVRCGVRFVDAARNRSGGGWRYEPGEAGDTSVLGWQVMALSSAEAAGIEVPRGALQSAARWLERVESPTTPGLYAYRPGQRPTTTMTAEATFVRQLLGARRDDPRIRHALRHISQEPPDWEHRLNTYNWYYTSLALFHDQGEFWRPWNRALTGELLTHQRDDGRAAGSWDPQGEWSPIGGRVYQTAICTLMLEIYYRYLPMYSLDQPVALGTPPAPEKAIGTITGRITDARSGRPLEGAAIRLDLPDAPPLVVHSGAGGAYTLHVPETPDFVAISAMREGYVPAAANIPARSLRRGRLERDFALQPASDTVVSIEAAPEVHHLGNNRWEGRINSQFQKRAEGRRYEAQFELAAEQVPPVVQAASLRLLAKGVQCPHRIRINGRMLPQRLDHAPGDGSFGEFDVSFDPGWLVEGANELEIQAVRCRGDLDDFEFVNMQIHLGPAPSEPAAQTVDVRR